MNVFIILFNLFRKNEIIKKMNSNVFKYSLILLLLALLLISNAYNKVIDQGKNILKEQTKLSSFEVNII